MLAGILMLDPESQEKTLLPIPPRYPVRVVKETIPSSDPAVPEKAQIAIQSAGEPQEIRIDNILTMKNGEEVGLKKNER